jgi:hypothetical protein
MLVIFASFSFLAEPNVASAVADSVTITLQVDTGITITSPADTIMSTSLGVSTNIAVATTTWNVKTNDSNGYTLGLSASTNSAMQSGGNRIADYATTSIPSLWSVASGNAKFGFSVTGTDVTTATWGTGSFCNGAATSTVSTTLKYYGFYTTATTTASRSSTTTPSGVDTTVCTAVEQNGFYIPSGTYTATLTATATAL